MFIGPALGFLLPSAFGVQYMLYIRLGLSALMVLLVFLCFEDKPPTPANPSSDRLMGNVWSDLAAVAKNRSFWGYALAFAAAQGVLISTATVGEALIHRHGFTSQDAQRWGCLQHLLEYLAHLS